MGIGLVLDILACMNATNRESGVGESTAPRESLAQRVPPAQTLASLHDLIRGLLWPRLLRTGALALRPAHIGLAFFLVALLILLSRVPDLWLMTAQDGTPILNRPSMVVDQAVHESLMAFRDVRIGAALSPLIRLPRDLVSAQPLAMLILALPMAILWGVFGGAIARSAAWQVARGERLAWNRAFGQALSLMGSLVFALLGPVVTVLVLLSAMTLGGRLLLDKPQAGWIWGAIVVVGVLGATIIAGAISGKFKAKRLVIAGVVGLLLAGLMVLGKPAAAYVGGVAYGLALLMGMLIIVLGAMSALGLTMLTSGVMVEGTDAVDAVQRVWAYIIARPGRFAMYLLLLAVQCSVVLGVVCIVVFGSITLTAFVVTRFVDPQYAGDLRQFAMFGQQPMGSEISGSLTGWQEGAGSFMAWWTKVAMLTLLGVFVSFVHCAGSLLYLSMRQLCDGQDFADIWDPTASTRVSAAMIDDSGEHES